MANKVTIKFLSGQVKGGQLLRGLDPDDISVELLRTRGGTAEPCALEEIAFIKFLGEPDPAAPAGDRRFSQEIKLVTGDHFHLSFPQQPFIAGFIAHPVDPASDFHTIFIPAGALTRQHAERLHAALTQLAALEGPEIVELDIPDLEAAVELSGMVGRPIPLRALKRSTDSLRYSAQQRIGDILVEAGLVTQRQIEQVLAENVADKRQRLGAHLVRLGLISEEQLLSALAHKFELEVVDLAGLVPEPAALKLVPAEMMLKRQVLPLKIRNRRLVVATANPTDPLIAQDLHFAANVPIELVVAGPAQIAARLAEMHSTPVTTGIEELISGLGSDLDVQFEEENEIGKVTESDSKVINLVNKVLLDAYRRGASDIHFEPGMGTLPLKIRYRRDGMCSDTHQIAAAFKAAIVSRIKILAKLDITERRRPQSGKILFKVGGERIEYRVETTPTIGGQEDAVLRVLSTSEVLSLEQIGFTPRNLVQLRQALQKPHGLILCVGPTGAGKTTTLHAALSEINTPDRKIWTAEDPVEITQEGLRQVQVLPKIGFTFDEALRSFLRSDPDVIMIGEMRDALTCKTAIGASLTGHLVFSTLHTNSAAETVVRLIEIGIDPFNFADALLTIVAQRLARRLCTHCREPYHPGRAEYDDLVASYGAEAFARDGLPAYSPDLQLMRAKGCSRCEGQGYSGRIAIHEQLLNSQKIKQAIKRGSGVDAIEAIGLEEGMMTLRQDGILKIFEGLTDLVQINRVVL